MKKRIGSKLYDTDSSELIQANELGKLYRKRTRDREWFLVVGDVITPMTDRQARALIGESSYMVKEPDNDSIMIRVDRETHRKIAEASKAANMPISKFVKRMAEKL